MCSPPTEMLLKFCFREKFRQEGTLVIQDHVLPAYRKLAHFFQHVRSLYLL